MIEASEAKKLSGSDHSEKIDRFLIIADQHIRKACELGLHNTSIRLSTDVYPRDVMVMLVSRLFSLGYRAYLPMSGFKDDMFLNIEVSW